MSSGSWSASDSTISTAASVPATTRSSFDSMRCGLARVQHVLAVDVAHARGADRAGERDAGDRQRGARGDQRGDVGVDFGVQRHHVHDDLHFVEEAFGEQRAARAVDQARGQRLELARAAFTLEEAAGDLAGGVRLLDVVDRRAGRNPGPAWLRAWPRRWPAPRCPRCQTSTGAGGLAGDLAGFRVNGVFAPVERLRDLVEHAHVVLSPMFA